MKKLLSVLTIVFAAITFAQDTTDVPFDKRLFEHDKSGFADAVKEIKQGDFHFFDGTNSDLSIALRHYLYAQDFNSKSAMLNFKIGVCYLNSNKKFNALPYLQYAYAANPDVDENIKFYLAQAYQLDGDFSRAIVLYREFKDGIREGDMAQRSFINKKIQECRTGEKLKQSPVRVWIDNLGDSINTEYPEFSPVISADNRVLFFTARRPDSQGGKVDKTGFHYEDIYVAKRTFGTQWSTAKNLGEPVNTQSHDATVGLAPDGKSLLTYVGINSKNGDVLITKEKEDGTWEEPTSLGDKINTKHHESSASLSFDEKTLFFVSDQPDGFGQHDIYVSYWDEAEKAWGDPENLGDVVNTEFEEKGVFFHPDNRTLYFSSNGHNNMGGLDIFKTVLDRESGTWSKPENIGYPINTPDDDIYFVVTGNERYAYYSSYREDGFGEKDIYKITFLGDKKDGLLAQASMMDTEWLVEETSDVVQIDPNNNGGNDGNDGNDGNHQNNTNKKKMIIKGHVYDGNSGTGIASNITMVNNETGASKIFQSNPDGSYEVVIEAGDDFGFTVSATGYTVDSKSISTSKKDANTTKVVDFNLNTLQTGGDFTLRNIYFDFDKYGLRDKSVADLNELVRIMKENPNMVIELGGHTDSRGESSYNMALSESRAKVAMDYLIKKGVSKKRIYTRGYGEEEPEISDSEISKMRGRKAKNEAHQQNRRTVVTIIRK